MLVLSPSPWSLFVFCCDVALALDTLTARATALKPWLMNINDVAGHNPAGLVDRKERRFEEREASYE